MCILKILLPFINLIYLEIVIFVLEYDNYDNYNEYDNYHSPNEEYDPDMVKKEEPDDENTNGGNRYGTSYYPKPDDSADFIDNEQTDNYDD